MQLFRQISLFPLVCVWLKATAYRFKTRESLPRFTFFCWSAAPFPALITLQLEFVLKPAHVLQFGGFFVSLFRTWRSEKIKPQKIQEYFERNAHSGLVGSLSALSWSRKNKTSPALSQAGCQNGVKALSFKEYLIPMLWCIHAAGNWDCSNFESRYFRKVVSLTTYKSPPI